MNEPGRLTEIAFWDSQYDPAARGGAEGPPSRTKAFLRKLLGPKAVNLMRDYRHYLTWEVMYPKYLPRRAGVRALEVGSAPGTHLVQLNKAFGFEPYGVEYTARGAELNKQVFQQHGLDPANVIHADFLSPEFQARYRGYFDVVLSRGFIEHFDDVDRVVSAHVNVAAPGGVLVIGVPNLRGVNYGLTWFFYKELLSKHNLSIMNRAAFLGLFDNRGLTPLFCDYIGAFSFGLFDTKPTSRKRLLLALCRKTQPLLNAAFRVLGSPGGVEHRWFSSNLFFIGVKQR